MSLITPHAQTIPSKHDEQILVVKRSVLFPDGAAWHGLQEVDMQEYLHEIKMHQEFHPRSAMETDSNYKQIIPYMIFTHNNRFFLMKRAKKASESRLADKYTLGIGGHIRQEDNKGASIFDWARREFHEEVYYNGKLTITPLGILNDDSNAVGMVHVGLVLLLKGDSDAISIKSELASGSLETKEICLKFTHLMESWSTIVLERL